MISVEKGSSVWGVWSERMQFWFNRNLEIWLTNRREIAEAQAVIANRVDRLQYDQHVAQAKAQNKASRKSGIVNAPPPPGGNGSGISGPAVLLDGLQGIPEFVSNEWEAKEIR